MEWTPVPGLDGVVALAYLRRPDVCCSNAFLVAGPDAVIVVDAGADGGQAARIASEIAALRAEHPRPAFVLITHCHADHVAAIPPLLNAGTRVIAHTLAADVLEAGDGGRTAADLFGIPFGPIPVDCRLFSGRTAGGDIERIPIAAPLPGERLSVGGKPVAEVYHAPGHTPDGLIVRVGGLVFVGDLLFALDPGVAAAPGFDPAALADTVRGTRALLSAEGIEAVLPGHGRQMPVKDAIRILDRLERQLAAGQVVVPLTPERLIATRIVSQELLEEANRTFSVLGGRLLALAHHLAALGEEAAAGAVDEAFEDGIDACLASFSRFAEAHAAGERADIQLVLKAVQATGKIQAALGTRNGGPTDQALIGRFRRLSEDFLAVVATGSPVLHAADVDLNRAAADVVADATTPPVTDAEVLAAADDEEAFRAVLVRRLAAPPLFAPGAVSLERDAREARIRTDPDRLRDAMAALLEDLSGAGHDSATVAVRVEGDTVRFEIGGDVGGPPPIGPRRREAYRRRIAALGGSAVLEDAPFRCRAVFPGAGGDGASG